MANNGSTRFVSDSRVKIIPIRTNVPDAIFHIRLTRSYFLFIVFVGAGAGARRSSLRLPTAQNMNPLSTVERIGQTGGCVGDQVIPHPIPNPEQAIGDDET